MKKYIELLDKEMKPILGSDGTIFCDNRKSVDTLFNEVRAKEYSQRKAYATNQNYCKPKAYFMNLLIGSSLRDAKVYMTNIQI